MKAALSSLLFAAAASVMASQTFAQNLSKSNDQLVCAEVDRQIYCKINMPNFAQKMAYIFTNGWENTLKIELSLLSGDRLTVIQQSQLQATQRCYLDPFESPCLILWRGASQWQSYRDDQSFLKAISSFNIKALQLKNLSPNNYRVRATIKVDPSANDQVQSIRQWLRQSNQDSNFKLADASLVGVYMSTFTRKIETLPEHTLTLETTQFFIDIDHSEEPPPETSSNAL